MPKRSVLTNPNLNNTNSNPPIKKHRSSNTQNQNHNKKLQVNETIEKSPVNIDTNQNVKEHQKMLR